MEISSWHKSLEPGHIREVQLKGARMSVYFRWAFIFLVTTLLLIQLTLGYRKESLHAFILVIVYFLSNSVLWYAVIKKYNPRYLGFLSAILDVGVICSHLLILSLNHDQLAVTSAATLFLIPVLFLLYTFRLDRMLMVFLIGIALAGLSLIYFINYFQAPEFYRQSISISTTSHFFRIAYILFIGILCIYLQHFMFHFIDKQIKIACEKADAELQIRMEEEKNNNARQLISQERALNKKLENEIRERTRELTEANTRLLELQKTNLQSQFEVLKQQVNPHFLFNSLNVLASLIKVDPDLAESFTEKLSMVYRYVLENKEKDMVSLSTEIDFINSYIFLLNIRFKGKIFVKINMEEIKPDMMILPMALQILIENAIKHNTFSKTEPLRIGISVDRDNFLVVTNNLRLRESYVQSTGIGLTNIQNRYKLITDKEPVFEKTDNRFIARIPLIMEI
jgi:sensor histidine kinase YesM